MALLIIQTNSLGATRCWLTRRSSDTGNLEQELPALLVAVAEAARERDPAVCLFIDEVQYLSAKELAAVVVGCHEIAQQGLPLLFIGAGLPQVAALAGNARSYAERLFSYPEDGPLDPEAARRAIIEPARGQGIHYLPDAVDELLRQSHRYPYFLQVWGFFVWNATVQPPVRPDDVTGVSPSVVQHLDDNFFRVRFDRLTALQQRYLRAMAELGPGPHRTGDVATALGVSASSVAPVRQQLIEKGMIWS